MEKLVVIDEDRKLDFSKFEEFEKHVKELEKKFQNRTAVVFALQKELDDFIDSVRGLERKDKSLWVRRNALAAFMEIPEFIDGFNWKWWTNKKEIDKSYLAEELADAIHFIVSGLISAGMNWADTVEVVGAKDVFSLADAEAERDMDKIIDQAISVSMILGDVVKESGKGRPVTHTAFLLAFALEGICRLAGMTGIDSETLYRAYVVKNYKNRERQRSKDFRNGQYYAGV